MKPHIAEFPKHPPPLIPQPQAPQQSHVQPAIVPIVYVYERQRSEYRVVTKNVAEQPTLSEPDLNALGKDGWELVGVVQVQATVQFVFKRVKA
jgi:hypothetical protein